MVQYLVALDPLVDDHKREGDAHEQRGQQQEEHVSVRHHNDGDEDAERVA